MKKYTSPSCKAVRLESAEMLALSMVEDGSQTTTDGGWSNHRGGWNSEDWSAPADDEE